MLKLLSNFPALVGLGQAARHTSSDVRDPRRRQLALRRIGRLALQINRGAVKGLAHYRAQRRFAGPGLRMGLDEAGKPKNYHFFLSSAMKRDVFKRFESSPQRRATLVLDVTSRIDAPKIAARTRAVASIVGGVLLGMPDSIVQLSVFGVQGRIVSQPIAGLGAWLTLDREIAACRHIMPAISPGMPMLRTAAAIDDSSHAIFVTPWIDPAILAGVHLPQGGTMILVEPPAVRMFGSSGLGTGWLAGQPSAAVEERLEHRFALFQEFCRRRRFGFHRIAGRGDPLDAVEEALAEKP